MERRPTKKSEAVVLGEDMPAAAVGTGDDDCLGSSKSSKKRMLLDTEIEADPAGRRCVKALFVAINQASGINQSYTTMKELQLVSLELCEACRNASTGHLRVDRDIPTTLLASVEAPGANPAGGAPSRVPRFQARRAIWELPSLDMLSNDIDAVANAEELYFGRAFDGPLETRAWPSRLKIIEFTSGSGFDRSIVGVRWPTSLQRLTLGGFFNQPIEGVTWPHFLQHLMLGGEFDQSIEGVMWPRSLEQLIFGYWFNQPIDRSRWPKSLLHLTLGHFFNQMIDAVTWPASLRQLKFGGNFNTPIDSVTWPSPLQQLTLGGNFNCRIEGVMWPPSLEQLRLGGCFNQPIEGVAWPMSLQQLTFGWCFDQLICGVTWPTSLRQLTFGRDFNQAIDGVAWPSSLERITFGRSFDQPIGWTPWLSKIRQLTLMGRFQQPLQKLGTVMPALERLTLQLRNSHDHSRVLCNMEWPAVLAHLVVGHSADLTEVSIPRTVSVSYESDYVW